MSHLGCYSSLRSQEYGAAETPAITDEHCKGPRRDLDQRLHSVEVVTTKLCGLNPLFITWLESQGLILIEQTPVAVDADTLFPPLEKAQAPVPGPWYKLYHAGAEVHQDSCSSPAVAGNCVKTTRNKYRAIPSWQSLRSCLQTLPQPTSSARDC